MLSTAAGLFVETFAAGDPHLGPNFGFRLHLADTEDGMDLSLDDSSRKDS